MSPPVNRPTDRPTGRPQNRPSGGRPAGPPTSRPAERKNALGRRGEQVAARYLTTRLGWTIVERNWRCPEGELDIVAFDGRRHIVCEVKTRSSLAYGAPLEAITTGKAARLRRLAQRWAAQHGVCGMGIRIDVIGLIGADPSTFTIEHAREVC